MIFPFPFAILNLTYRSKCSSKLLYESSPGINFFPSVKSYTAYTVFNYLMVFSSIFDTILGTGDTEVEKISYHYLLGKTDNVQMNVICMYVSVYTHP